MPISQTEGYFESPEYTFCCLWKETSEKKRFPLLKQNQGKFFRKTCWKEQPFIFTVWSILVFKHLYF